MTPQDAIRRMVDESGTTYAQVSRDLSRNDRYIAVMLSAGNTPSATLLARIANACGYELTLIGHGETLRLEG